MKLDSIGRPYAATHPLRNLGDYTEKNDERAANDPVIRKGRVRIKKRIDQRNHDLELTAINQRLNGWDL